MTDSGTDSPVFIVLYTLIGDFGRVRASLVDRFSDASVEVGPTQSTEDGESFSIRLADGSTVGVRISTGQKFIGQHIAGMYGFYARVPCTNQQLHQAVLAQVQAFNCAVSIAFEPSDERNGYIQATAFAVAKDINALVFMPNGSLYSDEGALVLSVDGTSDFEEYVPVGNADWLDSDAPETPADTARRERSVALLTQKNIPYLAQLRASVLESEASVRPPDEIARRLYAIFATSTYSEARSGGESWDDAQLYPTTVDEILGGQLALSAAERAYLATREPAQQDVVNFGWRYECCHVLMWALGLCDLGYPGQLCDVAAMAQILWHQPSLEEFMRTTSPRTKDELLDAADLVLRYDWACVDARVNGRNAPAGLDGGVVHEWHYALSWLVGTDDWDDVEVHT